jgi:hypothetical protein
MKNRMIFCSLLFLFYSCIETIEIDTVPVNNILVVNSLITPDTLFGCYVSKVYAINDTNEHYVDNATVKIFDNTTNAEVCQLNSIGKGKYRAANAAPIAGQEYRIDVSVSGFPSVTGVTKIPLRQDAKNTSVIEYGGYDAILNSDYSELRFSIDDQYEESNYYEVLFSVSQIINCDWLMNGGVQIKKIDFDNYIYLITDAGSISSYTIIDPVIRAEGLMKYNPGTLVFSDNLFNQEEHNFVVHSDPLSGNAFSFIIYTLNDDLYKFRTSFIQHLYERGVQGISRYDDFAGLDFSSKAIEVYSNLTGGYGIFAGYNSQILFSKLDTQIIILDPLTGASDTVYNVHKETLPDGRGIIYIDQTENPWKKIIEEKLNLGEE